MYWTRLFLCALVTIGMASSAAIAQPATGDRTTISEETTIETTDTGSGNVMGLRGGTRTIEVPVLEPYAFHVDTSYRGVDDFFNIREANSNVTAGQWEFELETAWSTFRSGYGRDDDYTITASIKYGIFDDFFVELGLEPLNLGDGTRIDGWSDTGNGNGDANFKLFWQLVEEEGWMPAMALWSDMRIPTGHNSEKVDAAFHFNMTKALCPKVRGHLGGYIETANGGHGDFDRDIQRRRRNGFFRPAFFGRRFNSIRDGFGDRRHFQWGVGCGIDYDIAEDHLLVLNWLNESSEYYGNSNNNTIQGGWVFHVSDAQKLLMGVDYADTHGRAEGPRWTGKVQWSISF